MKRGNGIKRNLLFLLMFMLIFMFGMGIFTFHSLNKVIKETHNQIITINNFLNLVDDSRSMQVNFKKQVQSWKDLLLRGSKEEDYSNYYNEFTKEDNYVQAALVNLKSSMSKLGLDTSLVEKSILSHQDLHNKYVKALEGYDKNNSQSYKSVDSLVRGMDRGPTDDMDSIVKEIKDKSDAINTSMSIQIQKENKQMQFYLFIIIGISVCIIAILTIMTLVTYKNIEKFILQFKLMMDKADSGDLTTKGIIFSKDELGDLTDRFNSFIEKLRYLVSQTKEMSNLVADSSNEILNEFDEINKISKQISDTISEVANSTTEQAMLAQQGSDMVANVTSELAKANESTKEIKELAIRTDKIVEEGIVSIKFQNDKMMDSKNTSRDVSVSILNLSDKSSKIEGFVEFINEISEQTNLLALNASIEAARAGEAGKGFAVVADEIRKLAESSGNSANKIQNLINEIRRGIDETISNMRKAEKSIEEQAESLNNTENIFNEIENSTVQVTKEIIQVSDKIKIIDENSISVDNAIKDIASQIEQNAAGSEEVAASTQEQVISIEEMSLSVSKLSTSSYKLKALLDEYKV